MALAASSFMQMPLLRKSNSSAQNPTTLTIAYACNNNNAKEAERNVSAPETERRNEGGKESDTQTSSVRLFKSPTTERRGIFPQTNSVRLFRSTKTSTNEKKTRGGRGYDPHRN
ncbi:unnamed protein product [Sphenostylis stenocarpa]|uniref:Uncharacterized protein n=1 Tax=Sphenostylis stenocarpa TaxID=92480 RepID=A0AA86VIK7_9FABA|nr:unnamed protein product [Sphenostylis stenocarpa]